MLDVTPADVGDELDTENSARPKRINFHTRCRSSRRNAFLDKKSLSKLMLVSGGNFFATDVYFYTGEYSTCHVYTIRKLQ